MIANLARLADGLSKAERRVADVVLAAPHDAVKGNLRDLAETAGVSEPTALRFCRSAGYRTFREFQIALAQDLAGKPQGDGPTLPVAEDDSLARSTEKVFASTIAVLRDLRSSLAPGEIDRAAHALHRARRIDIYGLGASSLVAADAQHKLFRITSVASAYQDSHMQLMAAATLGPEDCALAISHSGATRDLLDTVSLAREAGATVIAISRRNSPLARLAHITLAVDHTEVTEQYTPMTSRIAHLVVVDALAVGLALLTPSSNRARLERMTRAIAKRRVPAADAEERAG